jgi:hypothetical protein
VSYCTLRIIIIFIETIKDSYKRLPRRVCWVRTKSSPVSVSPPRLEEGCEVVAILPSGFPVLKKKLSAIAGSGVAATAKASAAILAGALKGISVSSAITFLRRLWKIIAVNEAITVSRLAPVCETFFGQPV